MNITGLTAEGQQLARWAMEAWEMVANLDFQEVTSDEMITIDDEQSGAWAYAPNRGNDNGIEMNIDKNWLSKFGSTLDSGTFSTYIHEFGHAIGLGHQGNYNGSAVYGRDNTFANDSYQVSIMSYFDQVENTISNASFAQRMSAQMADIVAVGNLYGAAGAGSATDGNTTWGLGSNLGTYFDTYFTELLHATPNTAIYNGGPVTFTIYDVSGYDVVDISFLTSSTRIDLNDESFSDVNGLIGNVGIARGTILEELRAGSGNDTVTGNEVGNRLLLNDGNDTLDGGFGWDALIGNDGNDYLQGRVGDDRLDGGAGLDVLEGDAGNDILYGNGGHDTLRGGGDVDRLYGGFGNDSLDGSFGWDVLVGNDGADTLNGGIGNDRLTGGADADVFQFTAGDGTDTVFDYQDGTERIKILSGATAFGDLTINNDAGAAVITYGNVTIRLNGVADTLLDVTDFIF